MWSTFLCVIVGSMVMGASQCIEKDVASLVFC
jgi:hypothetical protein